MKALVGAFNQEKALVGAFSVIVQPVVEPMNRFAALLGRWLAAPALRRGIYTFARIHSHTIGRIEYGLRME